MFRLCLRSAGLLFQENYNLSLWFAKYLTFFTRRGHLIWLSAMSRCQLRRLINVSSQLACVNLSGHGCIQSCIVLVVTFWLTRQKISEKLSEAAELGIMNTPLATLVTTSNI